MIAEITAGLNGLKAATDLLEVLNATATQAQINEVRIGLQSALLEAQQGLFAAQQSDASSSDRIRDLERQILQLKDWGAEKQRYELKAVGMGAFAYVPKPGMENGEPVHWLCANCFEGGRKSIYQKQPGSLAKTHMNIPTTYECSPCGSKIVP